MADASSALNASNATLDRYFTNIKAATRLSPDYVSVDYSLQLQLGISRATLINKIKRYSISA